MANLGYVLGEHCPGYLCINPKQLTTKSRFAPDSAKKEEDKKKEKKERKYLV